MVPHSLKEVLSDKCNHSLVFAIILLHLFDWDMKQVFQSLENTKPECDWYQIWVLLLNQFHGNLCIVHAVREDSWELLFTFLSRITSNSVVYMVHLFMATGNPFDPSK